MASTSQNASVSAYYFINRHTVMNSVTYKIVTRKDAINKKGESPLYLQVFINKERDLIPLSIQVNTQYWNPDKQICTNRHKDADLNNEILDIAVTKTKEILRDANRIGMTLSKKIFREKFYLLFGDNFTDFFINQVELRFSNNVISPATRKTHRSLAMKFKRFANKLSVAEIDKSMIERYEAYMLKLDNNVNSRRTALKVLHTYVKLAIGQAKLSIPDPFDDFTIPSELDTRESLKPNELKLLLECYDRKLLPENLHNTTLFFLLSCYTGMRLMDVKHFGRRMIKENKLIYTPHKTKRFDKVVKLEMPIITRRIVEDTLAYLAGGGRMKTEQTINGHLKIIASELKINTALHFHMARHTFATTFIRKGGSVEVLQRILCHSKIETTMRYVGMIDDRIDREMKFFDLED